MECVDVKKTNQQRERKKLIGKKYLKIITIIIAITALVGGLVFFNWNRIQLECFEYDILIEEYRYEYEGVPSNMQPAGGYSSNYYYQVINSEKKEKYVVVYQDVWSAHNEKGDKDILSIGIMPVTNEEIEDYINQYGKVSRTKLKKLLNKTIKENYKIEKITRKNITNNDEKDTGYWFEIPKNFN